MYGVGLSIQKAAVLVLDSLLPRRPQASSQYGYGNKLCILRATSALPGFPASGACEDSRVYTHTLINIYSTG
jgi:hypothetical protein